MANAVQLDDYELRQLRSARAARQSARQFAFGRELLRRCPEWSKYADDVQRLKVYFPRGPVGFLSRPNAGAGVAELDYLEGLYFIAKHASFGSGSPWPAWEPSPRR